MKNKTQEAIWLVADGLNILEEVFNRSFNKIGQIFKKNS